MISAKHVFFPAILITLCAVMLPSRADVTILSENFEGVFPGEWSVGSAIPGGSMSTWQTVNSSFGGVGTHGGQGKGFCAGSLPNYDVATLDFSSNQVLPDSEVLADVLGQRNPNYFQYRPDGHAWQIINTNVTALAATFDPSYSGQHTLVVTHLSSADDGCPGGGYSPVTITSNGLPLASCYDPASNHGGTHAFVTDSWTFNAMVGSNVVFNWSRCGDACTFYWIQRVAFRGPRPYYPNFMSAFMQRSLNLTGCTNATLSFWHIMPTLDVGFDYGRVLIDGDEIWRATNSVGSWSQVQLNLNSYTGAWHVLRFEFDSDDVWWGRGWYLDDILLTTSFVSPTQTNAPMVFAASDFPNQIGEYYRAYRDTNATVGTWIAQSGAAQRWDFSQSQQSGEFIQRMEIVPPANGDVGGDFPDATYAERYTTEFNGNQSWSFYSLTNAFGRYYHGFNNPIDQPIYPVIVYVPPVLQFPTPIRFGQAWRWETDFVTQYQSIIELVHLTTFATVDGYGKFVLSGDREVPTLRVKELQLIQVSISGTNAFTTTSTNYYWLVRGVGLAAQISITGTNVPLGPQLLRVFEAGDFKDLLSPVHNLRLRLQDSKPALNWDPVAGSSGYRVEFSLGLTPPNWQLLDLPLNSPWTNALPAFDPQGFFRVFARP